MLTNESLFVQTFLCWNFCHVKCQQLRLHFRQKINWSSLRHAVRFAKSSGEKGFQDQLQYKQTKRSDSITEFFCSQTFFVSKNVRLSSKDWKKKHIERKNANRQTDLGRSSHQGQGPTETTVITFRGKVIIFCLCQRR